MASPNIYDVARRAGVSFKTVSRVLNGASSVRAENVQKVKAAVQELNYRPNIAARRLAGQRSFQFGVVYDAQDANSYNMGIHSGALITSHEHGFELTLQPIANTAEDVVAVIEQFCDQSGVDGLILASPISEMPEVKELVKVFTVPCVSISPAPPNGGMNVSIDELSAADEITSLLLQYGHEHIGFIKGHPDHHSSDLRFEGFKRALERVGLGVDETLIEQGFYSFDSGYKAAERLLQLENPPTAVFASDDSTAIGVMHYAHEIGLDIPAELSVVGFDDELVSRYVWPPLTTVRQPVEEMGKAAIECLLECMENKDAPEEERTVVLPHDVQIRKSTARPKK